MNKRIVVSEGFKIMIIGVCGFGYTGSGAVRDFLKEFEDVTVGKDVELSFLYDPDGILNLEDAIVNHPIRFFSGDSAIKRFKKYMHSYDLYKYMERGLPKKDFLKITDEYIDSLIHTQWKGYWHFDKRSINRISYFFKYYCGWKFLRVFDKLHIDNVDLFPNQPMYLPIEKEHFYKITQQYMSSIIEKMNPGRKDKLVLDQPFPANNPSICFSFFNEECKAIVVIKDPRDMYCFVKKYGKAYSRFIPSKHVKDFIYFYKYHMDILEDYNTNMIILKFEDMIYDYDKTSETIKHFLGINSHVEPKKYFDPGISIGNTQIFRKCPELENDVDIIESQLKEYLYPFDEQKASTTKKPFVI